MTQMCISGEPKWAPDPSVVNHCVIERGYKEINDKYYQCLFLIMVYTGPVGVVVENVLN